MQVGANIDDRARAAKYLGGQGFCSNGTDKQKDGVSEGVGSEGTAGFMEMIKEKKDEIFKKVINGETEGKVQIGAQAFTDKEWDRLLRQFDSAEDAIKEKMREEYAKRFKKKNSQEEKSDSDEKKEPLSDSDTDIEELLDQIL